MTSFLKRLGTSVLLIGVSAYILLFTNAAVFSLEVTLFVGLALYELLTLLKKGGVPVYRVFGVAMGVSIPLIVFMEFGSTQSGEILFIVLGCLSLFLLQFFRKENSQALVGISLTLFAILYVSWFLSFLIKIRFMDHGIIWIAYLLSVTKAADIGAYLVGSLFGKNMLIPHISPKKTVEGMFGGIFFSVICSWCFGAVLPVQLSALHLAVLGCLIGVVGQVGDLSESLMKRSYGAKDSGTLLPGMGGVLDAVDSILFTAPIFYFHLQLLT